MALIEIRPPRQGDARPCAELAALVVGPDRAGPLIKAHLEQHHLIVAEAEGEVIGLCAYRTDWFQCTFVSLVVVQEKYRRRGIARELMRSVEAVSPSPASSPRWTRRTVPRSACTALSASRRAATSTTCRKGHASCSSTGASRRDGSDDAQAPARAPGWPARTGRARRDRRVMRQGGEGMSAELNRVLSGWLGVRITPMFGRFGYFVGEQLFACYPIRSRDNDLWVRLLARRIRPERWRRRECGRTADSRAAAGSSATSRARRSSPARSAGSGGGTSTRRARPPDEAP